MKKQQFIEERIKKFKAKFPLLRVFGSPDHEPDEYFVDEIVVFLTESLSELVDEVFRAVKVEEMDTSRYRDSDEKCYAIGFNDCIFMIEDKKKEWSS